MLLGSVLYWMKDIGEKIERVFFNPDCPRSFPSALFIKKEKNRLGEYI